jgi:ribosomal protein S18 acetylase RimI-like enzyme
MKSEEPKMDGVSRPEGSVVIRVWEREDLEDVRRITWETWVATYASFIPVSDLRAYFDEHYSIPALQELAGRENVSGFVAVADGVVAGYLKAQAAREEGRFYVSSVYVLPGHQGKRLGTRLMQEAEGLARRAGFDRIWLGVMVQNLGALDWYRKTGFQFVEEAPFTMGKTTVNHLIGYRVLPPS